MLRPWRVVAFDVNGAEIGELGRAWTWRGAEKQARFHQSMVYEPIQGRKLYEVRVVAPTTPKGPETGLTGENLRDTSVGQAGGVSDGPQ